MDQKDDGHLARMQVNGVHTLHVLGVHFLAHSLLISAQITLLLVVNHILLDVACKGSLLILFALIWMVGVSGLAQAMMITSMVKRKIEAMLVASGWNLILFFACGIVRPVQAIPSEAFQRIVTLLLPLTLPTESVRHVMNRGGGGFELLWSIVPLLVGVLGNGCLAVKFYNVQAPV